MLHLIFIREGHQDVNPVMKDMSVGISTMYYRLLDPPYFNFLNSEKGCICRVCQNVKDIPKFEIKYGDKVIVLVMNYDTGDQFGFRTFDMLLVLAKMMADFNDPNPNFAIEVYT